MSSQIHEFPKENGTLPQAGHRADGVTGGLGANNESRVPWVAVAGVATEFSTSGTSGSFWVTSGFRAVGGSHAFEALKASMSLVCSGRERLGE